MYKYNLRTIKSEKKFGDLLKKKQFKVIIKLCKKQCSKEPSLNHYYFMAKALQGLQQYAEAVTSLEQALKLDPNHVLLYEELYLSLTKGFGIQATINHLYGMTQSNPHDILAYRFLRDAMNSKGIGSSYQATIEKAIAENAGAIEPILALTYYYKSQHKIGLAEGALLEILKYSPNHPEALVLLGNILAGKGKFDAATACARTVLENNPHDLDALNLRFRVHFHNKEYQNALECLKLGIKNPDNIYPWMLVSYLRVAPKLDVENEAIKLSRHFLSTNRSPFCTGYTLSIYSNLSQIFNKRKNYDMAFHFAKLRNDNVITQFNPNNHARECDTIKSALNERVYKNRFTIEPEGSSTPVFIVGMPRSGTSLTEQILSQHSKIYSAGECTYIPLILGDLLSPEKGGINDINKMFNHLSQDIPLLKKVRDYYFEILRIDNQFSTPFFTDKLPQNFMRLGMIKMLFPEAKIIHCCRSPLDTCISNYFQFFGETLSYSNKLEWIGRYYLEYEKFMNHWKKLGIDMLEVQYEDTVTNIESSVRRVLDYCDLPWEDACLDFYKSDRHMATASSEQVNKPIYNSSVQRWKNYEKHIQPLIELLGER